LAKPPDAELGKLALQGTPLTPVGAIRSGNSDGTIPEWTGGIAKSPTANGRLVDPFSADVPLFTIDARNVEKYRDRLTPGDVALIAKYPSFKMQVFPTRRSASFPQRIYEKSIDNARTGRLVDGGEGVADVSEGFPFPILDEDPEVAAYQAMWNHKLKYKSEGLRIAFNQAVVTSDGNYTLVHFKEELLAPYYKEGSKIGDIENVLAYFRQESTSPPRLAGQILLVHETLNARKSPRQAWIYNPGQRRVRRAPNVAYDNPGTAADGLRTNDMFDMFNGAMDRFTWKLLGKREMYVPYNQYRIQSEKVPIQQILRPGHLNPDLLRYELHRVWVVEAVLRPEARHINSRRTFYLDEDSWQILAVEHYDAHGDLWRYSEAAPVNFYQVPVFWTADQVDYDLKSGRYCVAGLENQEAPRDFGYSASIGDFSPQSLREAGIE